MSALLADRRTGGQPDPAEEITVTLGDKTFRAGRRTAAHIEWTIQRLAEQFPSAHLHVMQSCYNTGVPASKYTHDYDGVLDFRIDGLAWPDAQRFLRDCGWASWWRHTGLWADLEDWHLHSVSLGCPGPVGIYVPAQVDDYYRHALGLKGQHDSGDDPTWHPADIDSTVFDYEEQDMTPAQEAKLNGIATAVASLADMVEALAEGNDAIRRRITKAKKEIVAAVEGADSP